jgi:AcrR family transcriptional regulator
MIRGAMARETIPWRGDPLPRGRHKLSPEEVRASQRERILRAMLELVADRGYAATSVPDVVTAARVSKSGFYSLFDGKVECFVALLDEMGAELLESLFDLSEAESPRQALERGMSIYLSFWQGRPLFARAYFVELPGAGAQAVEQRERQLDRFAALFEALGVWARHEDPSLPPLPPSAPYLVVGGITELVAREVRAGRTESLSALRDELIEHVETVAVRRA